MKKLFCSIVLAAAMICAFASPASGQGFGVAQPGPLSGNCQSSPSLGIDTAIGQPYICGGQHVWSGIQISPSIQLAQSALTTVTTAQTMFTVPACSASVTTQCLSAGVMNAVGKTIEICGEAMFSNGATTPAITIAAKFGAATAVSVTTASNANTNSNAPLNWCFRVTTNAIGATGTDEAHGWVTDDTATAWASGSAVSTYVDGSTAVSSTYDHTVANALTVTIASTATLTTVTPRHLVVQLLD